jgi:hypothetical protein
MKCDVYDRIVLSDLVLSERFCEPGSPGRIVAELGCVRGDRCSRSNLYPHLPFFSFPNIPHAFLLPMV